VKRRLDQGALGLLIVACILHALAMLNGCGASTLDRAERAYGAAHVIQREAVDRLHARVRTDVRESCPDGQEACARAVAQTYHAAEAGLNVSADALDTARRELAAEARGEQGSQTCARLRDAVGAVQSTLELLRAVGVSVPEVGRLTWGCDDGQ
jgi:hypothetical protein